MAGISNVFSYKGKKTSLAQAVGGIISGVSTRSVAEYTRGISRDLSYLAKSWQSWMRLNLSTKSNRRVRNLTPWPKKDKGNLIKTIKRPVVKTLALGMVDSKSGSTRIKMQGLFSKGRGSVNIGQKLNDWTGKPFAGWKDRAQRTLFIAMKNRLSHSSSLLEIDDLENIHKKEYGFV